jgi:hypothetical protein
MAPPPSSTRSTSTPADRRRARRRAGRAALALTITLALAPIAAPRAQGAARAGGPRVQPALRLDGISARASTVQLAVGASVATSRMVRLEVAAGAGPAFRRGVTHLGARGDVLLRFLLDPDRVARLGAYGGAGVSVRHDPWDDTRAFPLLVAGVEGRPARGVVPFVELGLGGGARLGVGLRRAMPRRR